MCNCTYGNRREYNRLSNYLYCLETPLLKAIYFPQDHSTNHVILQLVDQIHEVFKDNKYTLDVLNELSKAFDTVDHNILLLKNRNERKSW